MQQLVKATLAQKPVDVDIAAIDTPTGTVSAWASLLASRCVPAVGTMASSVAPQHAMFPKFVATGWSESAGSKSRIPVEAHASSRPPPHPKPVPIGSAQGTSSLGTPAPVTAAGSGTAPLPPPAPAPVPPSGQYALPARCSKCTMTKSYYCYSSAPRYSLIAFEVRATPTMLGQLETTCAD